MTHTPGPWLRVYTTTDDCITIQSNKEHWGYNATDDDLRLMTSAPDLLQALDNLLENVLFYEKIVDQGDFLADRDKAIQVAKDAIKKARGEV